MFDFFLCGTYLVNKYHSNYFPTRFVCSQIVGGTVGLYKSVCLKVVMEDCSHFNVHHLSAIERCAEFLEHVCNL